MAVDTRNASAAETIARVKRLESIFSPLAYRQREEKRQKDNAGVRADASNKGKFAHYTSAEAALKIITSKRLWMRSTTCMGDYREVQHGYDLLLKYFQKDDKKAAFFAAMDAAALDLAKSAVDTFDKWWGDIRVKTYIASVSDHNSITENNFGRLSMWRAFAPNAPRVAMVFSVPWYSPSAFSLGVLFSPVAYLSEDAAHAVLDEVVENVRRETEFLRTLPHAEFQGWVFQMLFAAVCCSKHEGFSEEREWRGVYTPALGAASLLESSIETVAGVPQTVYKIPFDVAASPALTDLDLPKILDRIIVGPTQFGWVMYEAFVDALGKAGVPDPASRVWISNLPIRG